MCLRRNFYVTFIRHGETELNRCGLIQGQGIDASLNETGKSQASALGRRLRTENYTFAYSSDQARARQTCEIILSENLCGGNGEGAGKNDIRNDLRIRERCYGIMEGRKREELEALARSAGQPRSTFVPDGAESISDIGDRAESFFLSLCAQCFDHCANNAQDVNGGNLTTDNGVLNVLVVSHGRLLTTLLTRFSEKYGCTFPPGKIGVVPVNTALSRFEVEVKKGPSTSSQDVPSHEINSSMVKLKCTTLNNSDHLVEK